MRIPSLAVLGAVALVAATAPASPAEAPARARASAAAATGTLGDVAAVRASGDQARRATVTAGQPDGIALAGGIATATAARTGGHGRAVARASARGVELLGGAVTAARVDRTATASAGSVAYGGAVAGLAVDGHDLGDTSRAQRYPLGTDGTVEVNTGGSGLVVTLTHARGAFPAGTVVRVAAVDASARDGADPSATPAPVSTPAPTPTARPKPPPAANAKPAPRSSARPARPAARPRARARPRKGGDGFTARLEGGGFRFPVDTAGVEIGGPFGAAREIGAHQGNDLFAAFGSPVVAVADGTVSLVGTLPISGNRLWLTTPGGDAFFYAHLSAFSPDAVNGRRVKAGTVLGFVGNTGDAEPTPPHLHFEIHPGGGVAVDPHGILVAWQKRAVLAGDDTAERPGALVEVRDLIAGG